MRQPLLLRDVSLFLFPSPNEPFSVHRTRLVVVVELNEWRFKWQTGRLARRGWERGLERRPYVYVRHIKRRDEDKTTVDGLRWFLGKAENKVKKDQVDNHLLCSVQ